MKKIILILSAAAVLISCGNGGEKDKNAGDSLAAKRQLPNPASREALINKITHWDSIAKKQGQTIPDKEVAQKLISSYNEFVSFYPADSMAPKFAFMAANVAVNIYSDQQALVLIDNAISNFPNHPEKVQMLFWKAMVYDDRMNDKDRAKQVYEQIIKEYPGTPAAQQAKDAMKWTGKSDIEMIREMEKKNNIK